MGGLAPNASRQTAAASDERERTRLICCGCVLFRYGYALAGCGLPASDEEQKERSDSRRDECANPEADPLSVRPRVSAREHAA